MRRPTLRRTIILVPLLAVACAGPTDGPRTPAPPDGSDAPVEGARWPFWPAALRIHPLSRLVLDPEGKPPMIEARIELLDPDGHTTRGLGGLTVMLRDDADGANAVPQATWTRNLSDLAINRLHFDDVTRTYLLTLELREGQLPDSPVLDARLICPDGRTLEAPRPAPLRTQ